MLGYSPRQEGKVKKSIRWISRGNLPINNHRLINETKDLVDTELKPYKPTTPRHYIDTLRPFCGSPLFIALCPNQIPFLNKSWPLPIIIPFHHSPSITCYYYPSITHITSSPTTLPSSLPSTLMTITTLY